ncbi:MAG: hypothetical protein WCK27_07215 [Verrucomicrobiota bacterium]|nr:hypothetical protein [Verrucomicrobiota bacterium]
MRIRPDVDGNDIPAGQIASVLQKPDQFRPDLLQTAVGGFACLVATSSA